MLLLFPNAEQARLPMLAGTGAVRADTGGHAAHGLLLPAAGRHGVQPAPVGRCARRLHPRLFGRALARHALRGLSILQGLCPVLQAGRVPAQLVDVSHGTPPV